VVDVSGTIWFFLTPLFHLCVVMRTCIEALACHSGLMCVYVCALAGVFIHASNLHGTSSVELKKSSQPGISLNDIRLIQLQGGRKFGWTSTVDMCHKRVSVSFHSWLWLPSGPKLLFLSGCCEQLETYNTEAKLSDDPFYE
jgi:hypothetical protein